MKKIILTVATVLLLMHSGLSQAPAGINYQSVVRNTSGTILANAPVGMRINIRQNSATGTVVYSETFNVTSSSQGLVNMVIGQGTVTTGNFNNINWGLGTYFAEIAVDANGGTNYLSMGAQQLMSVPYALYAKESGNGGGSQGPQGIQGPTGPQGPQGPQGTAGTPGAQGIPGPAGATGPAGPAGPAGATGATGPAGPAGPQGPAGTGGAGGTLDQAYDFGGAGQGRVITVDSGPLQLNASGTATAGLGIAMSGTGNSINAVNSNAGNAYAVIQAQTNSSTVANSALFGQTSGAARAITGEATAASSADAAVRGLNLRTTGGIGVEGVGFNGVSGQTNQREGYGVFAQNFDLTGPLTGNSTGVGGVGYIGVLGQTSSPGDGAGLASLDDIIILGSSYTSGTKNFRIDHPADPAHKYLNHFSIESDEVLNMYRGNVVADANGEAVVTLPDWFELINRNFSYQLTPIGNAANLYIREKLANGKFRIAGAAPNMEVSWVVYAERNDAYLQNNPERRQVEQPKEGKANGLYLHPEFYGQPQEKSIIRNMETEKK